MNFRLLMLCSCTFISIILSKVDGKIAKIIGGENADIKDFAYMASLRYIRLNKHFCGGIIVSHYHILTAAHCVLTPAYYAEIVIYVGTSSSTQTKGPAFRIQRVDIANGYTETKRSPDVAVITLQDYITFNVFQNQARLSTKDIYPGAHGLASGWGITDLERGIPADHLQKISLEIMDKSNCRRVLTNLEYSGHFCTFQKVGVGICIGDSGSPFVINGEVVGISSFVIPCAKGYPDVYTSIYSQLKFINSIIENHPYRTT